MRRIDVDDEVYAFLQGEAVPFAETTPNDVLRRLLLGGVPKSRPAGAAGDLMPLIEAGRLTAGDRLVHHQPRKGRTFFAEVTADGFIRLEDGRQFAAPSRALKECIGHDINGWYQWTVERTGGLLKDIRYE